MVLVVKDKEIFKSITYCCDYVAIFHLRAKFHSSRKKRFRLNSDSMHSLVKVVCLIACVSVYSPGYYDQLVLSIIGTKEAKVASNDVTYW